MRYKFAAFLDLFVGKTLLGFICHLPPSPRPIKEKIPFKNILVIKFLGAGSIIEATPLFRALRDNYPDIPMDILTFSENREIVKSFNLFRDIFAIDAHSGLFTLFRDTARFVLTHRRRYSLLIDLEFFAYFSALVSKMLAAEYSIGFKGFFTRRNICYSHRIVFDHSCHIRSIFLKFLDALYIERPKEAILSRPEIPQEKKRAALERFPSLNNKTLQIALNINSSDLCLNRRWPLENFQRLIAFLKEDCPDAEIYLVGGRQDSAHVENFYRSLPDKEKVYIAAGRLDILEFSYLLSKMNCFVTSDSGPLHIAESLGVPVVGFFGPETPNLYGPLSERALVFYKNIFCSPCLNTYDQKRSRCDNNRCLKFISPQEVYEKMKAKYFDEAFFFKELA